MKTSSISKLLLVVITLLSPYAARAAVAYNIPVSGPLVGGNVDANIVYGLRFTVGDTPLTLTDLGAFDSGQNGLISVPVALYSGTTGGTPLRSTTIGLFGDGDGQLYAGSAYTFRAVTPLQLNAGATYTLVAIYSSGVLGDLSYDSNLSGGSSSIQVNGAISHDGSYWSLSGFPNTAGTGPQPQYGGGSFLFTPVPEASHFALMGMGFLGMIYAGRAFWLRRKSA